MACPRDRFSELPAHILDKILRLLSILQAARMAVLSTLWRDSWFSLSELVFNEYFFSHIRNKYVLYYANSGIRDKKVIYDNESIDILVSVSLYVITRVLMHHRGPIRNFSFIFSGYEAGALRSRLFDIDQWLSFVTQNGVEEIHLSLDQEDGFLLPDCIFSCPTLRRLHLSGTAYDTANAPCVLLNFTELRFMNVRFEPIDLLNNKINAPMLEDLSFYACDQTMFYFNVTAPKLCMLTIQSCSYRQNIANLPVNLSLRNARTLVLDPYSIINFFEPFIRRGKLLQPRELNVECLVLCEDPLGCDIDDRFSVSGDISSAFIHLLEVCPKLREIHIQAWFLEAMYECLKTRSKLSKELYRVAQTLNSLHTLSLSYDDIFITSSEDSLLWVEGLLSSFPTLEKFIVGGRDISLKTVQKFLRFPRASPKVEILFTCCM
ncbi:unnamed protein product [Cuscuta campestris]|uniref:F-box domain-containing protein n=1 Tax=Cuscuta campestris TaxID=132261 RepID=A0A484NQQ1_9ASTE|nr:unnamed protein product [Cuscuta campestris]